MCSNVKRIGIVNVFSGITSLIYNLLLPSRTYLSFHHVIKFIKKYISMEYKKSFDVYFTADEIFLQFVFHRSIFDLKYLHHNWFLAKETSLIWILALYIPSLKGNFGLNKQYIVIFISMYFNIIPLESIQLHKRLVIDFNRCLFLI